MVLGDLTSKGFEKQQAKLWDEYYDRLQSEGKQPEKATQKSPQIEQNAEQNMQENAQELAANQPIVNLNVQEPNMEALGRLANANPNDLNQQQIDNLVAQNNAGDVQFFQQNENEQQNIQLNQFGDQQIVDMQRNIQEDVNLQGVGNNDNMQYVQQNANVQGVAMNVNMQQDNDFEAEDTHKSRKLNGLSDNTGFLPWEKAGVFDTLQEVIL